MALIKCTECGKDISDKALQCPHCGAPVVLSNEKVEENIATGESLYRKNIHLKGALLFSVLSVATYFTNLLVTSLTVPITVDVIKLSNFGVGVVACIVFFLFLCVQYVLGFISCKKLVLAHKEGLYVSGDKVRFVLTIIFLAASAYECFLTIRTLVNMIF